MLIKNQKTSIYIKKEKNITSNSFLFIHGFTGSHESWSEIRRHINNSSIALDIPGHGKSTFVDLKDDYTYDDWCTDIFLMLRQLKIDKINICGYSIGGRLALIFALKYPSYVNKLILEGTSLGIEDFDQRTIRRDEDRVRCQDIITSLEQFNKNWEKNQLFKFQKERNSEGFTHQRKIRNDHNPKQLSKSLYSFTVGSMKYLGYDIKDLKMPIYLINGKDDSKHIKVSKEILRLNHKSKNFILNNAHHNVHLENKEDYIYTLDELI